ncbi:TetR/AcrR family transcriptional regulator [Pseudonocardia sichuanensis]
MGHREDLLAGARRCLETRGYARTTARDLVAESGTNLASIGYHFGSKEALLNAAIGASFEEWAQRVRELALAVEAGGEPTTVLAASWDAMLASFAEYRGLAVAFTEAMAQAERQPALRAQLAGIYEQSRASVAAMIAEALGIPDGPQTRALATFQIVVCDGLLVQWLLDPDAAPSGPELGEAFRLALGRLPT